MNATNQRPQQIGARLTIVLVHGAFADASSWNSVIERLQQQGYTVFAPANPQAVTDHIVKAAQAVADSHR